MKTGFAKIILFGFCIIAVALILLRWKINDRAEALKTLENVYRVEFDLFNDEIHVRATSPKIKDLNQLAALIERAEKLKSGEKLVPWVLDLTGNPNLKTFHGVSRLQGLRSIIAVDCPKLENLNGISGLPHLSELLVSHNGALRDISAIKNLPSLVTLDLTASSLLLKFDVTGLPSLENLYLSGCHSLESLDVTTHGNLKQLYLDGCRFIEAIEGLGQLTQLTDLDVSNCQKLRNLKGLTNLGELIVLDMRNIELPDFSVIGELPKLDTLRLAGQGGLSSLAPFSGLQSLREIYVESCPNLVSVAGLPATAEYLGVVRCDNLKSLDGIDSASDLQHVDFTSCDGLEDTLALGKLQELTRLSFLSCRKISDISHLQENKKLALVRLGGTGVVPTDIEPLQELLPDTVFDFSEPE